MASVVITGCASPVGVNQISPEKSYQLQTINPLGSGMISNRATAVLHRYNLVESFDDAPLQTILDLYSISTTDDRRDLLYALSELSYLEGDRLESAMSSRDIERAPDLFLQAAVCAYYYLLWEGREPLPSAYDIRFREACDLYNRSLGRAFPKAEDNYLDISAGIRTLPIGTLTLTVKTDKLSRKYQEISGLLPSYAYKVRGFKVHNQTPGLGLPLIGLTIRSAESPNGGVVPLTAFLRLPDGIKDFRQGNFVALLELYSAYDSAEVEINGHSVPLETDSTTPLAYAINDSDQWNMGVKRFLTGDIVSRRLLLIQPYKPGRIPIVFVHGTASSPVWWAEMFNTLLADPDILKHFQFWFYQYNSSNIIVYSADELRDTLFKIVQQLDPMQQDPALQNMVIVGHSQGGLLAKLCVVRPDDVLWRSFSDERVEEIDIDRDVQDLIRRLLFFQPLPFVKRVIFISTPHRGSYLAMGWLRNITRKLISLPINLVLYSPEYWSKVKTVLKLPPSMRDNIPSSIDGMSADNPLLQSLASLPLAPGVKGHSIIAVKPGMDIETGDDGVVEFTSAHIDGMESEYIVRSGHSSQDNPFTIDEVRRILLRHLEMTTFAGAAAMPAKVEK
ncbi:MAG: hypothetical protein WBB19_12050 [Desulforhopalus sp.]